MFLAPNPDVPEVIPAFLLLLRRFVYGAVRILQNERLSTLYGYRFTGHVVWQKEGCQLQLCRGNIATVLLLKIGEKGVL